MMVVILFQRILRGFAAFFPLLLILTSLPPLFGMEINDVVSGSNQAPVAVGGNNTFEEPGKMVFFSAVGSHDPDGEIVLFEWDFEGDGEFDWNSTENGTTEHSYEKEGVYNATLRVTDDNNSSDTDVYTVFIVKEDDNGDPDYEFIRSVLTIVGVIEIAVGIGMIATAVYLKRKLYDRL